MLLNRIMKISLNWLRQYIEIPDTPQRLSEILTGLGLEVEGLIEVQSVPGGLSGLVVGEVVSCQKHPNADKLSLTTVDIGVDQLLQIVCGAPNVAQGQKVIVATINTRLYPTGGEPFVIKKGKIRGEVSEGMICAEDEIGIGTSHAGIIVLPADTPIGTTAADFYQLKSDWIYDIGLTPNRSDATSHIGVARDLAAYYTYYSGRRVAVAMPMSQPLPIVSSKQQVSVTIDHIEGCPRFSGISLTNIEVRPAPQWMQDRLIAIGVRPINNIVDITNFVLNEYGQPLHAYDISKIQNQGIVVRTMPEGSMFTTLDGKDRLLHEEDLMICDAAGAGLCIAGVFGGANSGVTDHTTEVFLEAAHFNALMIRKTSTRHNLRTDAARCFEKGSDPNITVQALERAVSLMIQYANAVVLSPLLDIYPREIIPHRINVKLSHINRLMGARLDDEQLRAILSALSIEIYDHDGDDYTVLVPTDKSDVLREADLIEEVLRIYGFNNIEIPERLSISVPAISVMTMSLLKRQLSYVLIGEGYNEMMGLSLIPSKYYQQLPYYRDRLVYINNTSNIHLDAMRPEMLLSGLVSIAHNINRQQDQLSLFEVGRSYQNVDGINKENELLTLWIAPGKDKSSWKAGTSKTDFFDIKRAVERILAKIGAQRWQTRESQDKRLAYGIEMHRGDQIIAVIGAVKDSCRVPMGIASEVYYAELDLAVLLRIAQKTKVEVVEIPKYPSSKRDLSLLLDTHSSYKQLEQIIRAQGGSLLQSIDLFDVYKDKNVLGDGIKSYAVSLTFVDYKKSLQDKTIDKLMTNIIQELQSKMGAKLR